MNDKIYKPNAYCPMASQYSKNMRGYKKALLIVLMGIIVGGILSCNRGNAPVISMVSLMNPDQNQPVVENQLTIQTPSSASQRTKIFVPEEWKLLEGDQSSLLLQYREEPSWYVVVLNLNNVDLNLVYEFTDHEIIGYNPLFVRKDIKHWNQEHPSVRALFNVSDFLQPYTPFLQDQATIPYFLSEKGTVVNSGYGMYATEIVGFLNIYDHYATIEVPTMVKDIPVSYASEKQLVVGGYVYLYDEDEQERKGRTVIGIKDSNHDGKCELLYVFIAQHQKGATQDEAFTILSQDFGCSDKIMFGGGLASCLAWEGKVKVQNPDTSKGENQIPLLLKVTKKSL